MPRRRSTILILLIILSLTLFGCAITDGVQKFAEPIDRQGCAADCRSCTFSRYEYAANHCYCICDDVEIRLY